MLTRETEPLNQPFIRINDIYIQKLREGRSVYCILQVVLRKVKKEPPDGAVTS